MVCCWTLLVLFWPSQGPTKDGCALTGPTCVDWAQNGPFGPKFACFLKMADFHGTGPIPSDPGSKCATFMSQTIFDDSLSLLWFFPLENIDFWLIVDYTIIMAPAISLWGGVLLGYEVVRVPPRTRTEVRAGTSWYEREASLKDLFLTPDR